MDPKARDHLHSNTAVALQLVDYKIIKVNYLAQQHRIAPSYAKAIFDLLPSPDFEFSEVEAKSKEAEMQTKEKMFVPTQPHHRMVGLPAGHLAYST